MSFLSERRRAWERPLAYSGLVLATIIWATTFVLVKGAVAEMPAMSLLVWRFALGWLALLPFSFRGLLASHRREWLGGALLGLLLFAEYALLTIGLEFTSADNAAFITSLYVPMAPVVAWLLTRERLTWHGIVGLGLAVVGLGLLSLRGNLGISPGDLLALASAVSCAAQVALTAYFASRMNPLTLAHIEIGVVALLSAVAALAGREPAFPSIGSLWGVLLYLGIVATGLTLWLQSQSQAKTSVTHAALIFVLEPVFAAFFAWVVTRETLDLRGWIGAAMILAGMIFDQLGTARRPRLNSSKKE